MGMRTFVYIIIATIIFSIGYFVYDLYRDNVILKVNNIKLEASIIEQGLLIEQFKKDSIQKDKINNDLNIIIKQNENEKEILLNKFNKEKTVTKIIDNKPVKVKQKRNLGDLAKKKPKLVENVVNKGTIETFNCFEKITNPDLKGDFNEVCK